MELIIGGSFQGKTEYALKTFSLSAEDVYDCSLSDAADIPAKKVISHFEKHILTCMRGGGDPLSGIPEDAIIIADDISCGVVPMDSEIRAWREECGKVLAQVADKSNSVTRIFCGLPLKLK